MKEFHKKIRILKYLLPTYWYEVITAIVKEANNKSFYIDKIHEAYDKGYFDDHNMNVSAKFDEFYFVINMAPENLMLSEKERVNVERTLLANEITKIEDSLSKYNLFDLFKFKYERVLNSDYYAWQVTCMFNQIEYTKGRMAYCFSYPIFTILLVVSLIIFI